MSSTMRRHVASMTAVAVVVATGLGAAPALSKAEDVGMSSERLARIHPMIQGHIDAGDFSGAITLVARKGRVVHFETHGLADVDAKKAMAKETLFRLASMT